VNINGFDADATINKLLLASGADLHIRAKRGSTALNVAAHEGYSECVKVLLAAGADISNADNTGVTSLHAASLKNHSVVAQLLLKHGAAAVVNTVARVRCSTSFDCCCKGLTALMMCTTVATVKMLLAAGADVHVTTYDGDTCMHLAARHSLPVPVVCLLIKADVDLQAVNNQGKTAAQIAHDARNTLIEQLLIRAAK
jgi:ankyrin repeat protein